MGQDVLPALILQAEVILRVEDAHNVVRRALANRVQSVAAVVDGGIPLIHGVLHPEKQHVGPVGADFPGGQIVKFKYVLDKFLLLPVDGPVLTSRVHHQPDLLLAHLIVRLVGVDAYEPEYRVGGEGQEPHDGGKQGGDKTDQSGNPQSQLLRLLHGDPLGHQLSENQGEVGEDEGDQHHGDGV